MSELKIQEDNTLYEIDPEILTFKLDTEDIVELSSNKEEISKQIDLKIINGVNEYLFFRIKTPKKIKLNFITTPSHCILIPKEEKIIKIRFKRDKGEELKLKSYKIQLEGFIINEEEKDMNPKTLFDKYKKSGVKVIGKIMQVRSQFLDKYENCNLSLSKHNSDNKSNEKSIFVSAISNEIDIENDKKNIKKNKNKEEKNPLLINKIQIIKETDIKQEDDKDKEILKKTYNNNSNNKIIANEQNIDNIIENSENLDKNENDDKSKININIKENSSNNVLNIEEEKIKTNNTKIHQEKRIKNEKIDLLQSLSKKQIFVGIISILLIIILIIYFTV